jgi:phosphopantetheinyl transferase (holo-ACP synthase)
LIFPHFPLKTALHSSKMVLFREKTHCILIERKTNMLYYETLSVQPMLQLNQLHTTIARLPSDLARRSLRAAEQQDQAQRAGAYVLLEKMMKKYTNQFKSGVAGIIKPEFTMFFDANSPLSSLHYDAYGKPYFAGHDNATVSISHAGYLVGCALVLEEDGKVASQVGIDVQNVDYELDRAERIAERYFSDGEKLLLAPAAADSNEYCRLFTRIWTRKEALLKYRGVGMAEISAADTTDPRLPCVFEEAEQTLTYTDRNGKKREELYYITVCIDRAE